MERATDELCPGWRALLPTDAELLRESRHPLEGFDMEAAALRRSASQRCVLDMLAVLSQLRYLSAQLHLLWRLLTAAEPAGAHARAAAAACPHLLATLCEIAVHRWAPMRHAVLRCAVLCGGAPVTCCRVAVQQKFPSSRSTAPSIHPSKQPRPVSKPRT